jgi:hypothetical protein
MITSLPTRRGYGDKFAETALSPVHPRRGDGTGLDCANTVTIAVSTHDEMTTVAEALRSDPRVMRSYTQTKQEGHEHAKKLFADQPDLLEMMQPDGIPAMVIVVPNDQTGTEAVAEQFRAQFLTVQAVRDGKPTVRSCGCRSVSRNMALLTASSSTPSRNSNGRTTW